MYYATYIYLWLANYTFQLKSSFPMPKCPQYALSPNSEAVLALRLFYKSSPGIPSFLQLKTNLLQGSACLAIGTIAALVTSSFNVSVVMVPSTLWTKTVWSSLFKKHLWDIPLNNSEKSVMINIVHGSSYSIITLISIKFQRDLLDSN